MCPPGSKSLTNRALLLAALAEGESVIRNPLWADDTLRMREGLEAMGFAVRDAGDGDVRVQGCAGALPRRDGDVVLSLGNAGTAYRFLTATCCLGSGRYELTGVKRMLQRPVGELVTMLRTLGARVSYLGKDGYPPLCVEGTGLPGGPLAVKPTQSSQYISAVLQVAPFCRDGVEMVFDGPVTSRPYVEMTLRLMGIFGVEAEVDPQFRRVAVRPGVYCAAEYLVEPDASNASYFLAAAAVVPGSKVTIEGLGRKSLQGDVGFADVLHQMGAGVVFGADFVTVMAPPEGEPLRGIDVDLNAMPDMAQTLGVVALFADGPTTMRNIGNLRVKETDRLAAMEAELAKLGAKVVVRGDDLQVEPPAGNRLRPAVIDTYDDHRMAMSFAVAGLRAHGVVINDPGCVNKTFPDFFDYLGGLNNA